MQAAYCFRNGDVGGMLGSSFIWYCPMKWSWIVCPSVLDLEKGTGLGRQYTRTPGRVRPSQLNPSRIRMNPVGHLENAFSHHWAWGSSLSLSQFREFGTPAFPYLGSEWRSAGCHFSSLPTGLLRWLLGRVYGIWRHGRGPRRWWSESLIY